MEEPISTILAIKGGDYPFDKLTVVEAPVNFVLVYIKDLREVNLYSRNSCFIRSGCIWGIMRTWDSGREMTMKGHVLS